MVTKKKKVSKGYLPAAYNLPLNIVPKPTDVVSQTIFRQYLGQEITPVTARLYNGAMAGNSYATGEIVYTVPANKRFFITQICLSTCDVDAIPSGMLVSVSSNSTDRIVEVLLTPQRYLATNAQIAFENPFPEFKAGEVIKTWGGSVDHCYVAVNIRGFLISTEIKASP